MNQQSLTSIPCPAAKPLRRRRLVINVLLALSILFCGMLIGGGVTAYVISARLIHAINNPETVPARLTERLRTRLELTDEQTQQVRILLEKRGERLAQFRARVLPLLDKEIEELRKEVEALLTPEQAEAWNQRTERLRELVLSPHAETEPSLAQTPAEP